jgi:hypothetical protein
MMKKLTIALILVGCCDLQLRVQALPRQTASEQTGSTAQKSENQPPASESNPATAAVRSPLNRFPNFSAVQNGGPLPGMDVDRYIYRSGNLMRMQSDATVPEYYITDLTKQQSYSVSARACLHEGFPYKLSFPFAIDGPNITYEIVPVGEDTVDGHHCRVEDLMVHNPKNPVVLHLRLYEAEDLQGFPIKIENKREQAYPWVIHYKEVKVGPQDPSLFIYPEKCESMEGFKKVAPVSKSSKAKSATSAKPQ